LKTLFFLRKEIKLIQPYSILSLGEYFNSFVLLALYGLKYTVFVSDRCQPNKSLGKFHDFLRLILYPKAKGVIVQTRTAKEIYQKIIPHAKLTVIGNPICTISPQNEPIRENIILTVGRLIKSKHHDELIRLFAQINIPSWKLIIIGDDALKQQNIMRLRYLVKELKSEDRIFLIGSRNDVDAFYLKSKIFVFTSSSEGFPNVIGEAMSAGLPVVAFNCVAGPSEMIQDGENGFLVPLYKFEKIKERLMLLMQDEKLRNKLGENAKKTIQSYSSEIIGEEFYSLLINRHIGKESKTNINL